MTGHRVKMDSLAETGHQGPKVSQDPREMDRKEILVLKVIPVHKVKKEGEVNLVLKVTLPFVQ